MIGLRHVELNGIYLPASLAADRVRHAAVALYTKTDGAWSQIGQSGSAFLYEYRGRRFCVFTKHQLAHSEPSKVYINLASDPHTLHSGGRFIPGIDFGIGDEGDLCAIEMPWTLPKTNLGASVFFRSRPPAPVMTSSRLFVVGFPSELRHFEGNEVCEQIHLNQVRSYLVSCDWDEDGHHVGNLLGGGLLDTKAHGNLDGFSGAPVFAISAITRAIEFCGIVTRGGNGIIRFVDQRFVDQLCERSFALPSIPVRTIEERPKLLSI